MNRPDIDRVMEVWMADGPTAIPDRVVDVVAARIGVQRQRRTWPFKRRTTVNNQLKVIAALAAVLIVAVVGYNLLPDASGPGGPTATPTAAPTPSPAGPSPSASAASPGSAEFPSWFTDINPGGAGILAAGSQTTRSFRPGFAFVVPEGWFNSSDQVNHYTLIPDTPANAAEHAASGGLAHETGVFWFAAPYWFCDAWEDHPGASAAEIVASVVATEAIAASEPVDVTVGGLTGKQVDIRLASGWTETCPDGPPTVELVDTRTRVIALDTPGQGPTFINVGSLHSAGHDAFLAEAMPIVETFEFDLGQ